MNNIRITLSALVISAPLVCSVLSATREESAAQPEKIPAEIKAIIDAPRYKGAVWGLRVVDLDTGRTLMDLEPRRQFLIGSVRKLFTTGELLNQIGPNHSFDTSVYRQGVINRQGTLQGDLVLVASGDLTMGGRTKRDGTVAVSHFDHNEANSLGNAELTKPNPLAGYVALAQEIAASGIKEITGDVVVDDRLFKPYRFREEFDLKPIFVNDDVVDLIINPTNVGELASVEHRPRSAALAINNEVVMAPVGVEVDIDPALPTCIGQPIATLPSLANSP
jgi:D-alanyl-D-alanine carboxypeptidase/D-alanyl-D-alanine-endopeptidase (penicillin-binding protein 4)